MRHRVRLRVVGPEPVRLGVREGAGVTIGTDAYTPVVPVGETYPGPYEVTPAEVAQVLATDGLLMAGDVTVGAIPPEYVVPAGTIPIGANGDYDVRPYASASVSVPTGEDGNHMAYGTSSCLVGEARVGTAYAWTTVPDVAEVNRSAVGEGRVA